MGFCPLGGWISWAHTAQRLRGGGPAGYRGSGEAHRRETNAEGDFSGRLIFVPRHPHGVSAGLRELAYRFEQGLAALIPQGAVMASAHEQTGAVSGRGGFWEHCGDVPFTIVDTDPLMIGI